MARQATPNDLHLTPKQAVWSLVVCGVALLGVLGWLGWTKVYENPERVFWDALANNLETPGVTRHIVETTNGAGLNEYVQLELGGTDLAYVQADLRYTGTTIFTETISTPTADYTRYTSIHTTTKGSNGQPLDFSKVLGVWGKSTTHTPGDALQHTLGQALLVIGIVPIGNLSSSERQVLMPQIRKAFAPDFSSVKHGVVNGQGVDIYTVQVRLAAYVAMIHNFAKAVGLGNVSVLNPANYKNTDVLETQFAINPASHEVVRISYPGSVHTEDYSGYGLQPSVILPAKTIPASELQQRLAAIE